MSVVKSVGPSLRYRWVILAVAWLAFVVAFMQRLSVGPLAPFLKEELNLTSSQAGLFMSAAAFGYMLTAVPAGWLVDRIGIRWLLFVGEVVGGLFIACMLFVTSFTNGLIFMALAGLGMGCLSPATTKAVIVWFPVRERATAMGIKQTSVNLGGIITASILPTVALLFGWRYGFVGIGLVAVVCGILSFVLYKEPPQSVSLDSPGPVTSESVSPSKTKPSVREIFRSRDIWMVALCSMFLCIVEFAAISYFVLYLKDSLLFTVVAAGFLLAVVDGGGVFGKPIVGLISDRIFGGGRRRVLIMLCCIIFATCIIFAFLGSGTALWLLIPVTLVFGFAAVGWAGLTLSLVGEFAGKELVGIAASLSVVLGMVGNIIGPPAFGYIVDSTGSYRIAWGFLAFAAVLAAIFVFFVRESRRRI